jgi:Tfp pilus assembly protein PilE
MKRWIVLGVIVVAVGILCLTALVAYPTYHRAYVAGSNIASMIVIKDVAIALERYRQERGPYPAAQSIDDLRKVLAPLLANARLTDRWGEPLVVDVTPASYTLTSKGEHRASGHQFGGAVTFSGHSITLKDGVFVQYDASVERTAIKYDGEIATVRAQARAGA